MKEKISTPLEITHNIGIGFWPTRNNNTTGSFTVSVVSKCGWPDAINEFLGIIRNDPW